jgi:ABC-type branched-chain amino acid transport systems, ATPase component
MRCGDTAGVTLHLAGITVRFGPVVALEHVSLAVPDGGIVGLIGPNGAGKTTVFNVICGLVTPQAGTMTRDGEPFRPKPHRLVTLGIARTLQHGGLFDSLTALENVMTGVRIGARPGPARWRWWRAAREEPEVRERARAMLSDLGLAEYAGQYPAELPYALRKKVALARALVAQPRLLLLDEPAAGLSAEQADELATLIAELPRQRRCSVLLVEHRLDLVMRVCPRVVVLDAGRVIAQGTPDQVRDDPLVVAAYTGAAASTAAGDSGVTAAGPGGGAD